MRGEYFKEGVHFPDKGCLEYTPCPQEAPASALNKGLQGKRCILHFVGVRGLSLPCGLTVGFLSTGLACWASEVAFNPIDCELIVDGVALNTETAWVSRLQLGGQRRGVGTEYTKSVQRKERGL